MKPWDYWLLDAYEWTLAKDVQSAWRSGVAEVGAEQTRKTNDQQRQQVMMTQKR